MYKASIEILPVHTGVDKRRGLWYDMEKGECWYENHVRRYGGPDVYKRQNYPR